ncbi:hypothetical protein BDZ91DRAFT_743005 [Kalaharituber pfeilii]|nr:hypothetical protein BDZ91DRAFT_743005 [Kalaharituber pfeilii]
MLDAARLQLLGYLGCLYAWRKRRGKPSPRVYGIATDGYVWQFMEVSDAGEIRESERLDIVKGGMQALERVMRGVMAVLAEATALATPFSSPEKGPAESVEGDEILEVTASGFLDQPPPMPTDEL